MFEIFRIILFWTQLNTSYLFVYDQLLLPSILYSMRDKIERWTMFIHLSHSKTVCTFGLTCVSMWKAWKSPNGKRVLIAAINIENAGASISRSAQFLLIAFSMNHEQSQRGRTMEAPHGGQMYLTLAFPDSPFQTWQTIRLNIESTIFWKIYSTKNKITI